MLCITTKQVHGKLLWPLIPTTSPGTRELMLAWEETRVQVSAGQLRLEQTLPRNGQTLVTLSLKVPAWAGQLTKLKSKGWFPGRHLGFQALSGDFWQEVSTQQHHQVFTAPSQYGSFYKANLFLLPPVLNKGSTKETSVVMFRKCKIELIRKIYAGRRAASCWPSLCFSFSNRVACLCEVHLWWTHRERAPQGEIVWMLHTLVGRGVREHHSCRRNWLCLEGGASGVCKGNLQAVLRCGSWRDSYDEAPGTFRKKAWTFTTDLRA